MLRPGWPWWRVAYLQQGGSAAGLQRGTKGGREWRTAGVLETGVTEAGKQQQGQAWWCQSSGVEVQHRCTR